MCMGDNNAYLFDLNATQCTLFSFFLFSILTSFCILLHCWRQHSLSLTLIHSDHMKWLHIFRVAVIHVWWYVYCMKTAKHIHTHTQSYTNPIQNNILSKLTTLYAMHAMYSIALNYCWAFTMRKQKKNKRFQFHSTSTANKINSNTKNLRTHTLHHHHHKW